ncbi:MAG: hypothetical protein FWG00_06395 [Coriobacteriia bacterium]|nr:hypothetical protein [Coriobacteriia bacterium]
MPQVSLYFDERLARTVSEQAQVSNTSVSKYVSSILYQHFCDEWSQEFCASLGALSGGDLKRPAQLDTSLDVPRESL